MKKTIKVIQYRRKLDGRTNYKKRLKLLISGTPRLVVRKSNKNILVQTVVYHEDGDKIITTTSSAELKKLGWKHATGNVPAAYLTGLLAAKKTVAKNVKNAIADFGLQGAVKGSRLYAVLKGANDGGLVVPCSEEVYPSEDRLSGKHIAEYGKTSKQFKTSPATMEASFKEMKETLLKSK